MAPRQDAVLGGRSSQNTATLRVDSWTGVIVKGANETMPLHVSLSEPYVCENVRVTLAEVRCKAVLSHQLITAIVPVFELPPDAGKCELRIFFGNEEKECRLVQVAREVGSKSGRDVRQGAEVDFLSVHVVDLVLLQYPKIKGWVQTLGAITYTEQQHATATVMPGLGQVAMLIAKTQQYDVPAIFVFGTSSGKAQLDRYEAPEQNLEDSRKWEFIDSCTLSELTVSSKGDESIIGIAHDVDFIYKPDEDDHCYHVLLRVGEHEFRGLRPVGTEWISWFTKQWVPRVAAGVGEGDENIERFTAPTISSLIKRQRKVHGDYRPPMYGGSMERSMSPGRSPGSPEYYSPYSPKGHKMDLMSTTQAAPGMRPTIMHDSATELKPYHKGDMVKQMGPRRSPDLNLSGEVGMAIKSTHRQQGARSRG